MGSLEWLVPPHNKAHSAAQRTENWRNKAPTGENPDQVGILTPGRALPVGRGCPENPKCQDDPRGRPDAVGDACVGQPSTIRCGKKIVGESRPSRNSDPRPGTPGGAGVL